MNIRWLALPLAGVLIAGACGGDGDTTSDTGRGTKPPDAAAGNAKNCPIDALESATAPVTVDVWYAFQGLAAKALEQMASEYNASQSKVVVNVANQGSYEEQLTKYKTALGKPESLPEVITGEDTDTRFMFDSKSIVSAEDCLAADPKASKIFDDLAPAVRAAYTVDGQLLPGAFAVSNPVLYFNKKHFAAAGLDTAKPPGTLAELRTVAEALKAAAIPGLEEPLVLKMDSWFIEHWLTGEGEPLVDQDNGRSGPPTKALVDTPQATEVLTWVKSMIDDGLVKPIRSNDELSAYLAVATQSGSMLIETSAAISTIDAAISGNLTKEILPQAGDLPLESFKFSELEVGVGPMPGIKAPGKGQIGGNGWYMPKKKPEEIAAAWDFLKYANSTTAQVRFAQLGGYLPSHSSAAADPDLQKDWTSTRKGPWLKTAYEATLSLDPEFTGPLIGAYAAFRTNIRGALDAISLQGAEPGAAIGEAKAKIEAAFAAYAANPGQG